MAGGNANYGNFDKLSKTSDYKNKYEEANAKFKELLNSTVNKLNSIYPYVENPKDEDINIWTLPRVKFLDFIDSGEQSIDTKLKNLELNDFLKSIYNRTEYLGKNFTLNELINNKINNTKSKSYKSDLVDLFGMQAFQQYYGTNVSSKILNKLKFPSKQIELAPFVTETSAWARLAVKISLQEAVKNGCSRIAWTTGEQQDEVNQKSEPTYHMFYGSPEKNELGTLGNIYHKASGNVPVEITSIDFGSGKNKKIQAVHSLPITNDMIEKTYQGMPMFSLGAPQTNAAVAPGSQTATPGQTVNNVGVTPNTAQVPALNAQQQGHINNIANSYRNLNPYTQISFQPFQPENKTILSNVNSFITRKTVASLGLGTEYLLAKESMVGYEANQKSELEKETKAALALLSSPKYADEPSMKGMTSETFESNIKNVIGD